MAVEIPKPPRQSPVFAAIALERGRPSRRRKSSTWNRVSNPDKRQLPRVKSDVSASASLLVPLSEVCSIWGRIEPSNWRRHRLKKPIQVILIVVTVILGLVSFRMYASIPNPPKPQVWTPGCVASVPRSWGMFKGASTQSGLAFEDSAGTLRFLTNIPCDGSPVVALEIRRTPGSLPNGGNQ
jgi:hypothetical protein